MGLHELAGRVGAAGDELADAAARFRELDPGPVAFGADTTGSLGALGRALHDQLADALSARARESAAHGARLVELAATLRLAASGYADAEREAHQRHGREAG
jgi:hypothetical protein